MSRNSLSNTRGGEVLIVIHACVQIDNNGRVLQQSLVKMLANIPWRLEE